jgi:hypothetical protein
VERTEGWAAGLRLAALSLAGHPDPEQFAEQFSGTLIETIPDEVLAAVGRDLRQGEHFYTVKSDLVSGWVIGGSASGRQDQKSYSARTMFDGWAAGDEVIRLFAVNVS